MNFPGMEELRLFLSKKARHVLQPAGYVVPLVSSETAKCKISCVGGAVLGVPQSLGKTTRLNKGISLCMGRKYTVGEHLLEFVPYGDAWMKSIFNWQIASSANQILKCL